jgi:hypothetical protein
VTQEIGCLNAVTTTVTAQARRVIRGALYMYCCITCGRRLQLKSLQNAMKGQALMTAVCVGYRALLWPPSVGLFVRLCCTNGAFFAPATGAGAGAIGRLQWQASRRIPTVASTEGVVFAQGTVALVERNAGRRITATVACGASSTRQAAAGVARPRARTAAESVAWRAVPPSAIARRGDTSECMVV